VAGPVVPTSAAEATSRPLGQQAARLSGGLLHDWQQRNVSASLPLALRQLESAGNLANVRLAIQANANSDNTIAGRYRGPVFMDSDIYKTLEAIGWELSRGPNPELAEFAATVTQLLEQAQQPDGYLNSYVQVHHTPRYATLASSHEMYCAGHLIQAGIALNRGAADPRLLHVATRLADHLVREFGGQRKGLDGHPIIETALTELYRETRNASYLQLASQFVDQRGYGLAGDSGLGRRYLQDHLPIRKLESVTGHAVRALYLEAGVTDVATEQHDDELLRSSISRWDDMVATKSALTGGKGSRHVDEGFGDRFELPPDRAYNETCAAIASFHWSWRLLLATSEAKYADHMERELYNGFAGAIATEGDRFFYVNPLQRREDHFEKDDPGRRRTWFSCACCPPNIMRLLGSLHYYLATADDSTLYVHQYASSHLAGAGLGVEVATDYPWSGLVTVRITAVPSAPRTLALRIPAWSTTTSYKINNFAERAVVPGPGYLLLEQDWRPGDEVTVHLDVTPRWTYPDRRIDAVRGCAAIERGPLVYCFEQADQLVRLDELVVRPGMRLAERDVEVDGIGRTILLTAAARHVPPASEPSVPRVCAAAIPYFQWDNRGPGPMRVWIPGA
jgi:uncharacterized protein